MKSQLFAALGFSAAGLALGFYVSLHTALYDTDGDGRVELQVIGASPPHPVSVDWYVPGGPLTVGKPVTACSLTGGRLWSTITCEVPGIAPRLAAMGNVDPGDVRLSKVRYFDA